MQRVLLYWGCPRQQLQRGSIGEDFNESSNGRPPQQVSTTLFFRIRVFSSYCSCKSSGSAFVDKSKGAPIISSHLHVHRKNLKIIHCRHRTVQEQPSEVYHILVSAYTFLPSKYITYILCFPHVPLQNILLKNSVPDTCTKRMRPQHCMHCMQAFCPPHRLLSVPPFSDRLNLSALLSTLLLLCPNTHNLPISFLFVVLCLSDIAFSSVLQELSVSLFLTLLLFFLLYFLSTVSSELSPVFCPMTVFSFLLWFSLSV